MANQPETATYDAGVYQIETADPVQGGAGGLTNRPLLNLSNRTAWLAAQVAALSSGVAGLAPLNSPAMTGTPTAPDGAAGDSSNKIANTRFVQGAASGIATVDVSAGGTIAPAVAGVGVVLFTGAPAVAVNVIFPAGGRWAVYNAATTSAVVTVKTAAGTGVAITQGKTQPLFGDGTNIRAGFTDFNNVTLTGIVTVPTPSAGDNGAHAASTAYVDGQPHGSATLAAGAGSWTIPAGVFSFEVEIWGGGGGSYASQPNIGSGGAAAGGYAKKLFAGIAPGTAIPYVVASGGIAGTPTTPPGAGGTSSFGSTLSATGGQLNVFASVGSPLFGGAGGGNGVGGDINAKGSDGGNTFSTLYGSPGGSAPNGGGMRWVAQSQGNPGLFPGGGASGAGTTNGTVALNGAAGGDGLIRIKW